MLNINDIKQLLVKAEEVNKQLNNSLLKKEIYTLKQEMKGLTSYNVTKDIAEVSCEYYANEIKHTLALLTK